MTNTLIKPERGVGEGHHPLWALHTGLHFISLLWLWLKLKTSSTLLILREPFQDPGAPITFAHQWSCSRERTASFAL